MPLDGPRAEQLHRRLLAAFPQRYALEKLLLFKLSVELDTISTARDLDEVIFYVIKWARTHDRVGDLLIAARAAAPDDAELQAFDVGAPSAASPSATSPTTSSPTSPRTSSTTTTDARATAPKAHGRAIKGKWKLWENGSTLRVAFLDGTPSLQARVAQVARRWTEHANLRFGFGASPDVAELRVSFKKPGSWSMIGTDALEVAVTQPTINFGWLTDAAPDEEIARVVLHEFGHALGLIHEFVSPNAKIPWDWDAMRAFFQGPPNFWSKEAVDANFAAASAEDYPGYRAFDPDSIMMFSIPAGHTTNGVGFQQGSDLSAGDADFAAELYPPTEDAPATDPPDDGTSTAPSPTATTTTTTTSPTAPPRTRARARARVAAPSTNELKMLFLASQPLDQQRLELASEYQEILEQLSPAEGKKTLLPIYLPGIAPKNLYRHFLNFSPVLVHFSGHGDASGQLMFTDAEGDPAPASIESIANLFGILTGRIRCVVLNACYSKVQAQAIGASIECVIGMSRAIKDTDAIDFADAFYWSIGHGQSVATAFRVGCNRLSLVGRHESVETRHAKPVGAPDDGPIEPSDEPVPILLVRAGADPEQIALV